MHRRRTLVPLTTLLSLLGVLLLTQPAPAVAGDLATEGRFLPAFSEEGDFDDAPPATIEESVRHPAAVTSVALPNGKFLYWNGLENLESDAYPLAADAGRIAKNSRTRVLDLSSGSPAWSVPSPEDGGGGDLFCSDQRILLDGTVMAAGGTIWKNDPVDVAALTGGAVTEPAGTAELFGNNAVRIYGPARSGGGTWTQAEYMKYGRWYPTLLTMTDGRMFVAGGVGRLLYNDKGINVRQSEIFDPYDADGDYDPVNGSWTENGVSGETTLPLFPRLHLIHDGRIFYGANGQMWGPFGQSNDQALWNVMKFYDPATNSWSDIGTPAGTSPETPSRLGDWGAVSGAAEVLLPFTPNEDGAYNETKILQAGGVLGTSPGSFVATNLSRVISISNVGRVSVSPLLGLNNRRWYSSSVIGATGDVFLFNGADKDEVVLPGSEQAVRQAEMYDVANNAWIPLATSGRDRTYHNSALLMADGRMLIGGHSPINAGYGPGENGPYKANDLHKNTGLTANNLKDSSLEIFEPPYLFRGPRPAIAGAPADLAWGSSVSIATPDADTVDDAILVHMPSTTHVTDADMRAIVLPIRSRTPGSSVTVNVPSEKGVAAPGYYYLFLRRTNAGFSGPTVSVAKIVRVGDATVFGGSVSAASATQSLVAVPKAPLAGKAAAPAIANAVAAPAPARSRAAGSTSPARRSVPAYAVALAALVTLGGVALHTRRTARVRA